jgi:hypothetical protein
MTVEDGGMAPYLHWLSEQPGAQWRAVNQLTTPPFNTPYADEIKARLRQHGCQIEEHENHYIITFPTGTQKKLSGPVTMVEPHTIRLPDGYEIREQYDRVRAISVIALPKE